MNFEQKAQDRKSGMSLEELRQFIQRLEKLGVSGQSRLKANSIKLQSISVEGVWSD